MTPRESGATRRRFLTTGVALSGAIAVAGCLRVLETDGEDSDAEPTETEATTDDSDAEPTETEATTDDSDAEPTETEATTEDETATTTPDDISGEYTLEEGDGTDPNGELAKPLTFQGIDGETVTMTMTSEPLDPVLVLEGPDGEVVAENDDNGKNTNSRLQTTLEASGEYTVWCGSFFDDTGAFSFVLRRGSGTFSGEGETEPLSYGDSETYTLQEGDGSDPKYLELARPFTFRASSDDRVTIEMSSESIDTYLLLTGPNGEAVAENDDGGTEVNSRITTTLDQSGEYTIWAGSYSGNETGEFTISLSERQSDSVGSGQIAYGESRSFTLDAGDGRDPLRGGLSKPIRFDGRSDDSAVISMTSETIDTYLVLEGPNGEVVAENDDGGTEVNSRITATLDQTGEYTIWCGSFGGGETGEFTLSLSEGSAGEDQQ